MISYVYVPWIESEMKTCTRFELCLVSCTYVISKVGRTLGGLYILVLSLSINTVCSYDMVQDAKSKLLLQHVFIICFVFEGRQTQNFVKFYSRSHVYSVIDLKINKLGNGSIGYFWCIRSLLFVSKTVRPKEQEAFWL